MLPRPLSLPRRSRAALAAGVPTLAAAIVAVGVPCACPDHAAHHAGALAGHATAQARTTAAHGNPGDHAGAARHAAPGRPASAEPHAAAHADDAMGFEVGSPQRPTIERGPRGPLWKPSRPSTPGRSAHGTFAEISVARQLEALRAEKTGRSDDAVAAIRAAAANTDTAGPLTTAAATKQLSKKCQRLLKAKPRKLRKADRKRRDACAAQRRKLIEASKSTGVTAPAPVVAGPRPTTPPPADAAPTTSAPTTGSPADTPTTTTPPVPTAREKVYEAVGVRPTDTDPAKWTLTRSSAIADVVNFELVNVDSQVHDLKIAPVDANGAYDVAAAVTVIGYLDPGKRKAVDVALQPGVYMLLCSIPAHGEMRAKFTVHAPPAT